MKIKKIMFVMCFLLLVLCINLVSSAKQNTESFELEIEPINDKITIYGAAKFSISVRNKMGNKDNYKLTFGDSIQWPVSYTEPHTDHMSGFSVAAREKYTTQAFFKPDKEIGKGYRTAYITVKSLSTDDMITMEMPVYIMSLSSIQEEYVPHVTLKSDFYELIDPREEYVLKIEVENQNVRNITNLEVYVESNTINDYQLVSLGPKEKKKIEFPIKFDELVIPQNDVLKVRATAMDNYGRNYEYKAANIYFEIMDYTGNFEKQEKSSDYFLLKKEVAKTYKNIGNMERTQNVRIKAPLWKAIFLSASPDDYSIITENGVRYYSWDITLKPSQEQKIIMETNYRIILYLILIALISVVAYYLFRSPIQVTKMAKNVELHKGVISEVKVMLNIKNISNHALENVKVLDKIPNMANITQDFDLGTVKPSKVMKHESQGYTIVRWDMDELDPHEDRLITYRMKSKLSIFGNFELPRTKVKYKTKTGKKRVVSSNKLVIHA